jgi:hypothetical protein
MVNVVVVIAVSVASGLAQSTFTPDNEGFIRNWLILAPLPAEYEDNGAVEIDKQQIKDEADAKPREGDKVKFAGKELVWKQLQTRDYFIDFREFVGQGQYEDVVGYGVTYVITDEQMTGLKLQMGSNDQAKVYVNGKQVVKFEDTRVLEKDQSVASDITLNKGLNVVVFKVANQKNNWQGCIRFTDNAGAPVKNIKVLLVP